MVLNNLITKSFCLNMFEMYPKGIYPCFHIPWSSKEQLFVELYFHIDFFNIIGT